VMLSSIRSMSVALSMAPPYSAELARKLLLVTCPRCRCRCRWSRRIHWRRCSC
jgi:hypothetical protein